jgi:polysaccharide biosynthesis transport protein
MRFLQTLQRKRLEEGYIDEAGEAIFENIDLEAFRRSEPPEAFTSDAFRIGAPTLSPVTGSSLPLIGHNAHESSEAVAVTAASPLEGLDIQRLMISPESVNPHLVAITQPRSAYCEHYRSLRTTLLLKEQTTKLQSIVVVSVGPSEGKSVTALNLAWLLAQVEGVNALVIDSDLRRPSLAGYLGVETPFGLSDVLAGRATLKETIVRLEPAGLHLLAGGEPREDIAEMISGPRFKEILQEARGLFDHVIIDAPPLGIFADAAVLINLADGALLVIKAEQTRYKDVDRILESLPRERMLGTVLNQSRDTIVDESYYGYGSYEQF